MKPLLSIFALCLYLCVSAQERTPRAPAFVSTAHRWHLFVGLTELPNVPFPGHLVFYTEIYRFQDTIQRNGHIYRQLWVTTDSQYLEGWEYTRLAFREEGGSRVYRYREGAPGEELMYDFSLGEGDVIGYASGLALEITEVDSVQLADGTWRKRMGVTTPWTPPYIPTHQPLAWIEGVGSTRNVFKPDETFVTGELADLLCFFTDEEYRYSDDVFHHCYMLIFDAEEELAASGWRIFPNPADGAITLDLLQPLSQEITLRLLNPTGRLIGERRLPAHTENTSWDISYLMPGLYLIEARAEGRMLGVKKFIKS